MFLFAFICFYLILLYLIFITISFSIFIVFILNFTFIIIFLFFIFYFSYLIFIFTIILLYLLPDLHDYSREVALKTSRMSKDKFLDPSMQPWMGHKYGYEPAYVPIDTALHSMKKSRSAY